MQIFLVRGDINHVKTALRHKVQKVHFRLRNIAVVQNNGYIFILNSVFSRLRTAVKPRYELVAIIQHNGLIARVEFVQHFAKSLLSERGSRFVAFEVNQHRQSVNHIRRTCAGNAPQRAYFLGIGIFKRFFNENQLLFQSRETLFEFYEHISINRFVLVTDKSRHINGNFPVFRVNAAALNNPRFSVLDNVLKNSRRRCIKPFYQSRNVACGGSHFGEFRLFGQIDFFKVNLYRSGLFAVFYRNSVFERKFVEIFVQTVTYKRYFYARRVQHTEKIQFAQGRRTYKQNRVRSFSEVLHKPAKHYEIGVFLIDAAFRDSLCHNLGDCRTVTRDIFRVQPHIQRFFDIVRVVETRRGILRRFRYIVSCRRGQFFLKEQPVLLNCNILIYQETSEIIGIVIPDIS